MCAHFDGSKITVHTALQGKQRGRCFPKAGKAKEKDFSPQFLQHFKIRNTSLPMNKMLDSRGIRVVLFEELLVLQSLWAWKQTGKPQGPVLVSYRTVMAFTISQDLTRLLLRAHTCKHGEELWLVAAGPRLLWSLSVCSAWPLRLWKCADSQYQRCQHSFLRSFGREPGYKKNYFLTVILFLSANFRSFH